MTWKVILIDIFKALFCRGGGTRVSLIVFLFWKNCTKCWLLYYPNSLSNENTTFFKYQKWHEKQLNSCISIQWLLIQSKNLQCPKTQEKFPSSFGNGEVISSDRRKLFKIFFPKLLGNFSWICRVYYRNTVQKPSTHKCRRKPTTLGSGG
jgi:hypothetical protein